MAKFRKKPVVIEAVNSEVACSPSRRPPWLRDAFDSGVIQIDPDSDAFLIKTLEGTMKATVPSRDWIIRGINGEIYPCKDEIFAKTYDQVDD